LFANIKVENSKTKITIQLHNLL